MKIKIKSNKDPYVLDYIDDKLDKLPALTEKNAKFFEAIVRLDSNYAKDLDINKWPSVGYDPETNAESSNGKFCGSTAWWFNEMKKPNSDFEKCVLGAVIAIDSVNSTHLESSQSGRKQMRDVICGVCNNYEELVKKLNEEFTSNNDSHLVSLLTKPTIAKKDGGERYNLSFATKFCAYASIFLNAQRKYSKYDNVVSTALPIYENIYLNRKVKARKYKIKETVLEEEKYQHRLNVYYDYQKTISEILDKLQKEYKINLTMEEFDHIVWYGRKG